MSSSFVRIAIGASGLALAAVAAVVAVAVGAGADAGRGEAVYADQKCHVCHSIGGRGNPRGPLDGVGSRLSADDIRQWIVNPQEMAARTKAERKPPMRGYPQLPPDDLESLVAYLQTLK